MCLFYTLSKQSSNAESLFCKPVIPVGRKFRACQWSPRKHLPSMRAEHSQCKCWNATEGCFFQHCWLAQRPDMSDRREMSQRNQWKLVDTDDLKAAQPFTAIHSLSQAKKVGTNPFFLSWPKFSIIFQAGHPTEWDLWQIPGWENSSILVAWILHI